MSHRCFPGWLFEFRRQPVRITQQSLVGRSQLTQFGRYIAVSPDDFGSYRDESAQRGMVYKVFSTVHIIRKKSRF